MADNEELNNLSESAEDLTQKLDDLGEKIKKMQRATDDAEQELTAFKSVQREMNKVLQQSIKNLDTFQSPIATFVKSLTTLSVSTTQEIFINKKTVELKKQQIIELQKQNAQIKDNLRIARLLNKSNEVNKINESIKKVQDDKSLTATPRSDKISELQKAKDEIIQKLAKSADVKNILGGTTLSESNFESVIEQLQAKYKNNTGTLDTSESAMSRLNSQVEENENQMGSLAKEEKSLGTIFKTKLATAALALINAIGGLIQSFRETQKQFGVSVGLAASLQWDALKASFGSLIQAFTSLGKKSFVSAKEILSAQEAFQQEFGGVISTEAGKDLARQAKDAGVTAETLAKARRSFLTTSMGDVKSARDSEKATLKAFEQQGMTNKDAYELIARYSELYARNGNRFASSFIRAAAEAKKIGVDLAKVDQVGDNIIDNFEGFLESQAELGAMGFNFDTSKLAEIAESGDTGALMTELRSELAAQGKDLTKLRRSEQLAISSAFGIPISELQRLAGKTPEGAGGEKKLSPEELQEKSNGLMERLIKVGEALITAIGALAVVMGASGVLGMLGKILPGLAGKTAATLGRALPLATGAAVGVIGGGELGKSMGATRPQSYTGSALGTAAGAGASMLAGRYIGGAIGTFLGGPVGTAIGMGLGGLAGGWLAGKMFGKGDDVVSTSGYGNRTLVTPSGVIALNNSDNIVAYADDLVSDMGGISKFPKGALTSNINNNSNVNNEYITRMEAKMDQMVRAIGSMQVTLDGNALGRIMVNSSERTMVRGTQRLTGTST